MRRVFISIVTFLYLMTDLTGCASNPLAHNHRGVCWHPAVGGGMPFPIDAAAKVDGNFVTLEGSEGKKVVLSGSSCIFVSDQESQ